MKRSTCLSAFLVGMSLTVASVAFAAPSKEPAAEADGKNGPDGQKSKPADGTKTAPKTEAAAGETSEIVAPTAVTDAQQTDGSGGGSGSAPATTAPATGQSTTQPAVSIGTTTTTPTADTPAATEPAPAAKPKPRPWAGSSLAIYNAMSTGTIFKGQRQDYNPTVVSTIWVLPRYAINEAFQLRGRMIITHEFTNQDSTVSRNETQLSDAMLQLYYRKLPKFAGIQPYIAANLSAPTSKISRARTMVVSPGVTAQFFRPIEKFLGGEAGILAFASYTHPFYRSETAEVVNARPPGAIQCFGGGDNCNNLTAGGTMNPSDILSYAVIFMAEWGKWNPAVYYLGSSQWVYQPKDIELNGQPITSGQSESAPGVRQTHYFSAWIDYNFNTWLTGEVGYQASSTALNEGSRRLNPAEVVVPRYQDMRVYFGASFQLDNLVRALEGAGKGEAGIVRARNKSPVLAF